jgi:hypothetical protein
MTGNVLFVKCISNDNEFSESDVDMSRTEETEITSISAIRSDWSYCFEE